MHEGKKFSGQPVPSQIQEEIPKYAVSRTEQSHQTNRYYNKLLLRVYLVLFLDGVFSYGYGLRKLSEGLIASEGKLSHLGLDRVLGKEHTFERQPKTQ